MKKHLKTKEEEVAAITTDNLIKYKKISNPKDLTTNNRTMDGNRKGVTEKEETIIGMGEETEGITMGKIMIAMIIIEVEIGIIEKEREMEDKEMIGITVGDIMNITETGIIGMSRAIGTTDLIEEEGKETMVVVMK
jgi:hypothetical protein